jgi:hypothetical protein
MAIKQMVLSGIKSENFSKNQQNTCMRFRFWCLDVGDWDLVLNGIPPLFIVCDKVEKFYSKFCCFSMAK